MIFSCQGLQEKCNPAHCAWQTQGNSSPAEHRYSWSLAATHLGSRLGLQVPLVARERLQVTQQGSLCQWKGWYCRLHLAQVWQMAWG